MIPKNLDKWLNGKDYKTPIYGTDKWFRHQLKNGRIYELMVGSFLVNCGLKVDMAVTTDIENPKTRAKTSDMVVNGKHIEVKSRSLSKFSDLYPLDSVKGYNKKNPKPHAYVIVDIDTWEYLWIPGHSADHWKIDKGYGKLYYWCKREQFSPMGFLIANFKAIQAAKEIQAAT